MNPLRLIQQEATEPKGGATTFLIWFGRLKEAACRLLDWMHVPGFVRPLEINDPVSGHRIRISASHLFTVISINGRDYYFRRLSGKYDGTGSGVGASFRYNPTQPACCIRD